MGKLVLYLNTLSSQCRKFFFLHNKTKFTYTQLIEYKHIGDYHIFLFIYDGYITPVEVALSEQFIVVSGRTQNQVIVTGYDPISVNLIGIFGLSLLAATGCANLAFMYHYMNHARLGWIPKRQIRDV